MQSVSFVTVIGALSDERRYSSTRALSAFAHFQSRHVLPVFSSTQSGSSSASIRVHGSVPSAVGAGAFCNKKHSEFDRYAWYTFGIKPLCAVKDDRGIACASCVLAAYWSRAAGSEGKSPKAGHSRVHPRARWRTLANRGVSAVARIRVETFRACRGDKLVLWLRTLEQLGILGAEAKA